MKRILILGAGFAGVAATSKLAKELTHTQAHITLIDRNAYHLFTPSLYEVATSEVPQQNVAIPLDKIFEKNVTILKDTVESIDATGKLVLLKNNGKMDYDFLVVALGSESAYFNIPGLKENAISFKKLQDALHIKNKIKNLCCKEGVCHRKVQVVIGGGGFSGTELAAEILTYKEKIAKQNGLDADCLQLTIIQGSDKLLKELDSHVSDVAQKRLKGKNVTFAFGGHIQKVDEKTVYTDDGKSYDYTILIWTGGVEANALAAKSSLPVNKRGQITVDETLRMTGSDSIFVAGDIACYIDPKTQKPVPTVAQVAEEQGHIVGENIINAIHHKRLKPYPYRHFGYVVPLKGRFAVAELEFGIHFDGIIGWALQQIVFLRYLLGILPFVKAFKRWNVFELELEQ